MKLYMAPGSCSTGIHILLEELELAFEVYPVNLPAGDQHKPEYLALNPKGTIPTLVRDDGTALTEFQSIAWWLARSHPKKGLIPDDADAEAKVIEVMAYVIGTIHMQGFTRIFTIERYTENQAEHEKVKQKGREIIDKGFALIERVLAGRDYVAGQFSVADAALFYVEFWAEKLKIELPENCSAHYQRMLSRPAVRQVLMEEGYRV